MKIIVVAWAFACLALSEVAAFSCLPSTTTATTSTTGKRPTAATTVLRVVNGVKPPAQDDARYWADMPLSRPYALQTPSVAAKRVSATQLRNMKVVMINEDYWLTWAMALMGPLIIWYHPSFAEDGSPSLIGVAGGLLHMLFAALLWVQTRRVRLVFDSKGFEFYNIKGPGLDLDRGAWLERKPDNFVTGTQNRWSYNSVTHYDFFPSLDFPVICYFKETETPEYKWNRWFAALDSYQRGQPHFFPGICNAREIKAEFEKRGVKRKPPVPVRTTTRGKP